jgi:hypothetical protein
MLGYSDALVASLLADGRRPQRVVVAVTEDVSSGFPKTIVSAELPFVPVPLRLTVLAMPKGTPTTDSRLVVNPFAAQRPDDVRGSSFLPTDIRWLLYPSSWYLTKPSETFDVPLNVPVSIGLPNDPLNRYMGLGAVVANPSDVDVRVSLVWEVLYTDAE